MFTEFEPTANIFKALCDPKRVAIVEELRQGERCACALMEQLGIAQSALSYHMKILCASGLVTCRCEGKWCHYQINQEGAETAKQALKTLTTPLV